MTNEQEDILDKVAKLMAKAKGTNNENEAAIFAAKAAELLAKHNLDEAMLREHGKGKEEGPIGGHSYEGRVPDRWRELILMGCAKLYFCKLVKMKHGKRPYVLYGREHNAVVAKLMAEYLMATVKRMAREYSADRVIQNDFRKGAGDRLYERLVELYNEQNKPPPVAPKTGTTLPALYAGEQNAIDAYIAEAIGPLRTKKARPMKMGFAAGAGRQAANSINLNTQVSGRKATARLR